MIRKRVDLAKAKEEMRTYALVAKFAFIWLSKVFPDGTAYSKSEKEAKCPVKSILIRGDQGSEEMLGPTKLLKLVPGSPVYVGMQSTISQLHPTFPKDCWYLPGNNRYWSNNLDNYMTISFAKPTRVYILLPCLSQEPKWLRVEFTKLRDPNFFEVHLKVDTKVSLGRKMYNSMMGQYDKLKHQYLRVFKSKNVFNPGETLVLGGPGLANVTDTLFSVAFHAEALSQVSRTSGVNLMPRALRSGDLHEFSHWHQQMIKSIKRNRLTEVRSEEMRWRGGGRRQIFAKRNGKTKVQSEENGLGGQGADDPAAHEEQQGDRMTLKSEEETGADWLDSFF